MLYFAYGSNMCQKQMRERCPGSSFLFLGYLDNYEFLYDGFSKIRQCAVANVIVKEDSKVWGAVFEISENDRDELDQFEGYPKSYGRSVLTVKSDHSSPHQAIVYHREGREKGLPSEGYKNIIMEGASDSNLPLEYIEWLNSFDTLKLETTQIP